MPRLTATIHGRVQGVGFRMFVQRQARRLRLTGWVRNSEEGAVETVAEGAEPALREFLAALRSGPSGSHVDRLDTDWSSETGEYSAFQIRY